MGRRRPTLAERAARRLARRSLELRAPVCIGICEGARRTWFAVGPGSQGVTWLDDVDRQAPTGMVLGADEARAWLDANRFPESSRFVWWGDRQTVAQLLADGETSSWLEARGGR